MNFKFLHSLTLGAALMIICTLIYAATETKITEINKQDALVDYLHENKLVVVEFYSPTCPVCIAFKKKGIFPAAAKKLPHIKFVIVSSQEGIDLHKKYKIEQFPTFVYFQDGKEIKRNVGYSDNPQFIRNVSSIFDQNATMAQPGGQAVTVEQNNL